MNPNCENPDRCGEWWVCNACERPTPSESPGVLARFLVRLKGYGDLAYPADVMQLDALLAAVRDGERANQPLGQGLDDDGLGACVRLVDDVCHWLASSGRKEAADALHDERDRFLLPLARRKQKDQTEEVTHGATGEKPDLGEVPGSRPTEDHSATPMGTNALADRAVKSADPATANPRVGKTEVTLPEGQGIFYERRLLGGGVRYALYFRDGRASVVTRPADDPLADAKVACAHPSSAQKWFNLGAETAVRWCSGCGALNRDGVTWLLPADLRTPAPKAET